MKINRVLLTVLFLSSFFFTATECDDECSACKSSIRHMASNIAGQGCNPNQMQKAMNRVREDCDHFDAAIGFMAETCRTGRLTTPGCGLPGTNLSNSDIDLGLNMVNLTDDDFGVDVVLNFPRQKTNFLYEFDFINLKGTLSKLISPSVFVIEGDLVEVTIQYTDIEGNIVELASDSKIFTYAWSKKQNNRFIRSINIFINPTSDPDFWTYDIEFDDW